MIDAVAATGLFDTAYYLRTNPELAGGSFPPLDHYVHTGEREGRRPNAYFDPRYYAAAAAALDPPPVTLLLLHYRVLGEPAGIAPSAYFDPVWYRSQYRVDADASPLADFLAQTDRRVRLPSPTLYAVPWLPAYRRQLPQADCFAQFLADVPDASTTYEPDASVIAASGLLDVNHYLINGTDVLGAGLDAVRHFCSHGWREGRMPNIYFDARWYLQTNPNVAARGINPLVHYLLEGEAAGRRPVVYFNPVWYRDTYDVPSGQSALAHFLAHRRSQRFGPTPEFDLDWYLRTYGQSIGSNRDPFAHYLIAGTYGDALPSASFDWAAYRRRTRGRRTRHFTWTIDPAQDNPLIHKLRSEYR